MKFNQQDKEPKRFNPFAKLSTDEQRQLTYLLNNDITQEKIEQLWREEHRPIEDTIANLYRDVEEAGRPTMPDPEPGIVIKNPQGKITKSYL